MCAFCPLVLLQESTVGFGPLGVPQYQFVLGPPGFLVLASGDFFLSILRCTCLLGGVPQQQDGVLATGKESSALARTVTNFDDIDEEDRAGRKTRLFKRNETQGYIDTASMDAASLDKVRLTPTTEDAI